MIHKLLKTGRLLLLVLLSLITIICSAFYWLAMTTNGAHWLLRQANQLSPFTIAVDALEGSILDGLAANRVLLRHKHPDQGLHSLDIKNFHFDWNPNLLLAGKVSINLLSAGEVGVFLSPTKNSDSTSKKISLPAINLPVAITAKSIEINNIHIEQEGTLAEIPRLNGHASFIRDKLQILSTTVQFQDETYQLSGSLTFSEKWLAQLQMPSHGLNISGNCSTAQALICEATAQWLDLTHPMLNDVQLPEGQLELSFRKNTLNASGRVQVRHPELLVELNTDTQTNFELGTSIVNHLEILPETGGVLRASGTVEWLRKLKIRSNITAQQLDFNPWLPIPQPKATLSADGSVALAFTDGKLETSTDMEIQALDFGREPLAGKLSANFENNKLTLNTFELANSYNHLKADGDYHWTKKEINLNLFVNATDFKKVSEEYSGKAALKAFASGNLDAPNLRIEGNASDISVDDFNIGYLALALDVHDIPLRTLENTQLDELSITLQNLQVPGLNAETLQMAASGSAASHHITAQASKLFGDIDIPELALHGSLTKHANGNTPLSLENTTWSMALNNFQIRAKPMPWLWELANVSQLKLAKSETTVADFCLSHESTKVCVNSLSFKDFQSLQLRGELTGVHLDREKTLFKDYYARLPSNWHTQGELTGRVDLTANLNDKLLPEAFEFDSSFNIVNAEIRYTEDDADTVHYPIEDTFLALTGNEQTLLITGGATIDEAQSLETNGAIKNVLTVTPDIDVRLRGNLQTLAYAQPFITSVDQLDGKAALDLTYVRNTNFPNALILGKVDITDAEFIVPATGSRVSQWQLSLDASQTAINLNGGGRIGSGTLDINGAVRGLPEGRFPFQATVNLNGSNLQLVDLPDASFNASPNLVFEGENLTWHLGGRLVISDSFMRLRELPKSASGLSEDAVIYSDAPPRQKSPLLFTSNIEIVAGKNITFEGFGLKTNINGHLNFARESNGHQQLHGSLTLPEGEFKSYGQNLKIENGQIIFSGSPSNPTLDVRAARTINNVQAGIWLNGTARHPKSQLYSSPSMSEGDILSYMLTGKPLAEQGNSDTAYVESAAVAMGLSQALPALQKFGSNLGLSDVSIESDFASDGGSVAAGKRLNDKLYVKYQYGLVGAVGRFIVEYSLTDNLTIEAGSGEIDTIDITYTWDSKPPPNGTKAPPRETQ